jgi:heterodisulfide reductase subunit A-like polyferredoxin
MVRYRDPFTPQVDAQRCIGCELCIRVCPHQALGILRWQVTVIEPAACDYCGICQELCPLEAISLVYEIVVR